MTKPTDVGRSGEGAEASSATGSAVRLHGIRKRFGFRDVLRGVDLDLPRGACAVLRGPNGAGKSTLIKVLATLWRPEEGEGEVLGEDLLRGRLAIRRRSGVLLHESFLRGELSLDENLRFAADLLGVSLGERCEELLERVGLTSRRRDRVRTFSEGMTRRAGIVRSLIGSPELWLLDEPFNSLDPEGQGLLAAMVREFLGEGGTVVLSTHFLDLVGGLATHQFHVEDGQIAAEAPPLATTSSGVDSGGASDG